VAVNLRFTADEVIECRCCLLRCIGRDWHIASFAALQHFVRYWSNSGQRWIFARDGLSAFDPSRRFSTGN
jgi:hypothetical protein